MSFIELTIKGDALMAQTPKPEPQYGTWFRRIVTGGSLKSMDQSTFIGSTRRTYFRERIFPVLTMIAALGLGGLNFPVTAATIINPTLAGQIMDRLQKKMKEIGFNQYQYGMINESIFYSDATAGLIKQFVTTK
jgi:hypothetical protein